VKGISAIEFKEYYARCHKFTFIGNWSFQNNKLILISHFSEFGFIQRSAFVLYVNISDGPLLIIMQSCVL
jgi:hypothetical protein